jgi:hypothetical protein
MPVSDNLFIVAQSIRVPGLGILVLPTAYAPEWLANLPLHTDLALHLHRPSQPSIALTATIEELNYDSQPTTRALLLDADPDGGLPLGSHLRQ